MVDNIRTANPGSLNSLQGNKKSAFDEFLKVLAAGISTIYQSSEGASGIVTLKNITTITGFTTLFTVIPIAYRCIINGSRFQRADGVWTAYF